jgi:hypothetical protein
LIHLEPLGRVGGYIILVDSYRFEVYWPVYPPQIVAERLDSYFIAPSIQRVTSGRMVAVGAIVITIPFIMAFALESVYLLVTILDPVTSVSILDDIPKISLTLVVLIR